MYSAEAPGPPRIERLHVRNFRALRDVEFKNMKPPHCPARSERQRQVYRVRRICVSRRLFRFRLATRMGSPWTCPRTQVTRRGRPGDDRNQVPRTAASAPHHLPSFCRRAQRQAACSRGMVELAPWAMGKALPVPGVSRWPRCRAVIRDHFRAPSQHARVEIPRNAPGSAGGERPWPVCRPSEHGDCSATSLPGPSTCQASRSSDSRHRVPPEAGDQERLSRSGDDLAVRHPASLLNNIHKRRGPRRSLASFALGVSRQLERVLASSTMPDGRLLLQIKDAPKHTTRRDRALRLPYGTAKMYRPIVGVNRDIIGTAFHRNRSA